MQIEHIRHSLAHILAMAVLKQYPDAKLGIGPTIENGFYYDVLLTQQPASNNQLPTTLAEKDLKQIEKEMRRLIKQHLEFSGEKVTVDQAKQLFKDQPFKLELIEEFAKEGKELTIYYTGLPKTQPSTLNPQPFFTDLCKGGHIQNTGEINPDAFTLSHVAGAYWRGDEKNPQLQRIYGLAFETKEELAAYLTMFEEAKKRDHKKLGPQLNLFMFHETAPGMPYWLPNGVVLLNELINFWRKEHEARGYQEIKSPLINKKELYETSGHWEHYRENMFIAKTEEKETYALKPMNCPNAMVVFGARKHSYRQLPLRLSDTDTLHRYERSGTLNGLLRVREFTQDDAHIFITQEQVKDEYARILDIAERFYSIFNLEYSFRLGTRPQGFIGDTQTWDRAEQELKEILEASKKSYTVLEGDGAFYGPKIDIIMRDALGREWQTGTIQLDFQIPRRFNLAYTDSDGKDHTPIVIHRVIYGSLERFIGIITEHFAGAFPFWIAPVQVQVLPISEEQNDYARAIANQLQEHNLRVQINDANETIGKKIREGELQKIPYLLIVGKKEIEEQTVAVRERGKGDKGALSVEKFLKEVLPNE